jgi:predicted sugar kinase
LQPQVRLLEELLQELLDPIQIACDELQRGIAKGRAAAVSYRHPAVEVGGLVVASDGEPLDGPAVSALAPEGATLVVSVALPGEPPVVVVGKVLRRDLGRARERIIRVEFALIREMDRDRILRFVLLTLAGANPNVHA